MIWDASEGVMNRVHAAIIPIQSDLPLATVLAEDFPQDCTRLPISGGWGYSCETAIIFAQSGTGSRNLDFVQLEYHIAEKIIFEELIIWQPDEARFSGIDLELHRQNLLERDGRRFDHLCFAVTCWSDQHWEFLKREWEPSDSGMRDHFDLEAHRAKRLASQVRYERDFWFDITTVLGLTSDMSLDSARSH